LEYRLRSAELGNQKAALELSQIIQMHKEPVEGDIKNQINFYKNVAEEVYGEDKSEALLLDTKEEL